MITCGRDLEKGLRLTEGVVCGGGGAGGVQGRGRDQRYGYFSARDEQRLPHGCASRVLRHRVT
jgi:hypothetical protein